MDLNWYLCNTCSKSRQRLTENVQVPGTIGKHVSKSVESDRSIRVEVILTKHFLCVWT